MSYVVLARKWRPQTFDDLVGQQHVSRTLANAIASERVAHAFLFTGVRGVGKTSSARILAKALNCEKGPTATPCLSCASCTEIGDGVDVDVQEIDGASYTGIDAVRSLQETMPYRPARDRFKIYIVDEVHMLSVPAWNAFLKTLEEPPPHVKFIFATTEANKVPVTILSRCQRYDFKLISTAMIAERLTQVLDAEGVTADDDAVRIIAREAAGSMRDAMSVLDQVIAWVGGTGERLSAEGVARVLGVAARSVLHRLGAAVLDGDAGAALGIIAELAEQGYALPNVARGFLQYLRDLVVASVAADPKQLIDLADDELADLLALAKRSKQDDLSRLYLGFSRSFDDIVRSSQPRGALEMALVRLSRRPPLLPLDELLRRLAELEQRLGGGGPPPGGQQAGGQRPSGGSGSPAAGGRSGQRAQPASHASSASPPTRSRAPQAPPARSPEPRPAPRSEAPPTPRAAPVAAPPAVAVRPSEAAKPPAPQRKLPEDQMKAWRSILGSVARTKPALASVYEHAAPLEVTPGKVTLGYVKGSFLLQQATSVEARQLLADAASSHFAQPTDVDVDENDDHASVQTVAQANSAALAARVQAARKRVEDHPLVHAAKDILGAELRDVRLPNDFA